jgi:GntR family transcriptional regulator
MARTENELEFVFGKNEKFFLDNNSPIPLYHQMERIMLERISKPEAVNKVIPPEFDLIDIFGVSRATIKKTLDNLVNKGYIERRRGIGTKVVKHQLTEDLTRLKSYTEEMESKGLGIISKLLQATHEVPEAEVRENLQTGEDEECVCIRRLRGTSEVFPVVLLRSIIPPRVGLTLDEDFSGSLYRIIEQKFRMPIVSASETIEAAKATEDQARALEIEPGDAVLIMKRICYTHSNVPVEYVRAVYRPDRYKFSIYLNR